MYLPENHRLLTAHYVDEARTLVETNWVSNEDGLHRTYTYDATEDNPAWIELLELVDEDQIHANTFNYIISAREQFEKALLEVGREAGELEDLSKMKDAQLMDYMLDILDKNDQSLLYKLKIRMFERRTVKKLPDNIESELLRIELRKTSTIGECFAVYSKLKTMLNELENK